MALSPVMVELRATIADFSAKMGAARAEVAKLESESNAHLAKFQSFGKAAALGVLAGVAAIGVESLKMAGDFQQSTSVLQTAAGETTAGLKIVRQGILDIARETGTTWQNLSEGMYQVEKAGYKGADGLKILRAAAQGAKEEGANLGTVTSAMTSVMASYNIPASKSVQVMNALKTAGAGTKDTMENFAASLSTVLPIASAAHISFAQVGGALAALTRHGTTAHEATQELNGAIRGLLTPLPAAQKAMAQMGISSVEVSQQLGRRGVTGTMQYLTQVIAEHTRGGLAQIGMMRQSASATDDLKKMIEQMSPAAKVMASDLMNNTITVKEYRKEAGHLDPVQAAMARQFATLSLKAKGFSDAAKAGLPVQTTMEAQLRAMTGGAVGLQTALMLTGSSMDYANGMTKKIQASMNHATTEVEGWHQTQNLLNTRLDRFKQTIDAAAISLGTALIPMVSSAIDWLGRHKTTVEVLAVAIGSVLVAAITVYVASLIAATARSVASFVRMAAAAAVWVAEQVAGFASLVISIGVVAATYTALAVKQVAAWVRAGAAAVAGAAVQVAAWVGVAAAATAAFIAENIASLGIIAGIAALVAAAIYLYKHWDQVWGFIKKITGEAVGFVKDHLLIFAVALGPIGVAAFLLYKNWNTVWSGIKTVLSDVWAFIQPIIGAISSAIGGVSSAIGTLASAASSVQGVVSAVGGVGKALHIPGFASGVQNFSGGLALVGERGPELVSLPRGSSVYPTGTGPGGGMNISSGAFQLHLEVHGGVDSADRVAQIRDVVNQEFEGLARELVAGRR